VLISLGRAERYDTMHVCRHLLLTAHLGLIASQVGHEAGEGVGYLKSVSLHGTTRCSRSFALGHVVDRNVDDDCRRDMQFCRCVPPVRHLVKILLILF
jgi:hypothetical protein